MQWVHYWRNIVSHYQVVIEGWPNEIPFDNLSKASSGIPALEDLRERWKSGETTWRKVDDEELQELMEERKGKLNCGELVEHCRRPRSDKGKKRRRAFSPNENLTSRPRKKAAYTSPATVDSENEMDSTLISSQNTTVNTVPLVDTPPALNSAPLVDTPPASNSTPLVNTPPASNSTPPVDTPPALNSAPLVDTPPAFNSAPLIDTPPASNSAPLVDTPPALNSAILFDTHLAFNSAPLIDIPVIQEPTTSFDVPFHPLVSLSSSSTGFIDFPFTTFDYEAAIANLNELLSGPALT